MAAMQAIRDRHERAAGSQSDSDPLHLARVEDVLYGLDINRHGVQLAACNLTLGNPRVDYRRMNLFTMRHGRQEDGTARAGSLEFLATARDRRDIASLAVPLPFTEELKAERAEPGAAPGDSLTGLFDLVIMNPPFTRNDIRNRQYRRRIVGSSRSVRSRSPHFSIGPGPHRVPRHRSDRRENVLLAACGRADEESVGDPWRRWCQRPR